MQHKPRNAYHRRGLTVPLDPNAIRGGSGLGDALYLQSVCRHLIAIGRTNLVARTDYPDVFLPLAGKIGIKEFTKTGVGIIGHYSMRRQIQETSQFKDCCLQAGITSPVELKLDWRVNPPPVDLRAYGKRIAVIGLPRPPMARKDGFGRELLPRKDAYQRMVDGARAAGYLTVQVGAGNPVYHLQGIDIDLANKTTIPELFDIVAASDVVVCYPSFLVPLAESLGKQFICLFAMEGLKCDRNFLRWVTPEKVIHRNDLGCHVTDEELIGVENAALHFFR